jgi:hypothetical protein
MIAPFLLLAATVANASPAAQPSCIRAPGSEITLCGIPPAQTTQAAPAQPGLYRLPRFGPKRYRPAVPSAQTDLGNGVRAKLRGQTTNSGRGRRNGSVATVSVPF